MSKPRKFYLKECMRDAYEEFAELLCEELYRKDPKKIKMVKEVKAAVDRVIKKEFGEDPGGLIDL